MLFGATLSPVSTRSDWREAIELRDEETGDLIDLTGCVIWVEVRESVNGISVLTGSTEDNVVAIVDTGVFEFYFPASSMRNLANDNYEVGCTIELETDGEIETGQIFIGTAPVLDGVVRGHS